MTTHQDLAEAEAFNRRRLVTALVSRSPGGPEGEPVNAGRAVVVGVVIALLLIAAAAVARLLGATADPPWAAPPSLVISTDCASSASLSRTGIGWTHDDVHHGAG